MIAIKSVLLATLLALVAAGPTARSGMVVRESKSAVPDGFVVKSAAPADQTIPLRIALVQSDMAGLEKALYDVSTPSSPNYGKHLSKEEVLGQFRISSLPHSNFLIRRSRNMSSPVKPPSMLSTLTSKPTGLRHLLCLLLATGSASLSQSARRMICSTPIFPSISMWPLEQSRSARFLTPFLRLLADTWTTCTQLPSAFIYDASIASTYVVYTASLREALDSL